MPRLSKQIGILLTLLLCLQAPAAFERKAAPEAGAGAGCAAPQPVFVKGDTKAAAAVHSPGFAGEAASFAFFGLSSAARSFALAQHHFDARWLEHAPLYRRPPPCPSL